MIILVHAYTQGLSTPTASRHNIFDSEKLSFLVPLAWRDSNLGPLDFESDALLMSHPNNNNNNNYYYYNNNNSNNNNNNNSNNINNNNIK